MMFKGFEVHTVNRFLVEEVPKSIGLWYPLEKVKEYFKINPQDGIWRVRTKEQKEGQKER